MTEESRWRVVTVMGEAGVGKSRLLFDFDAWLVSLARGVLVVPRSRDPHRARTA